MPVYTESRSTTDRHWDDRAKSVRDDIEVNIMDIFQRELEYDYICNYLEPQMNVLEVGCGNGFSTERFRRLVRFVDAFDYSESMVQRAKDRVGELNNRFFHDNVLEPIQITEQYDAVICVRVLINLRDIQEQQQAMVQMARFVKPGGLLILAEGFTEGFDALNEMREKTNMPPLRPASINTYSSVEIIFNTLETSFSLEDEFHLGAYDYLTRVVYPQVAGPDNVKHNTIFSEKCSKLARAFNPADMKRFSRIRGFVFRKTREA